MNEAAKRVQLVALVREKDLLDIEAQRLGARHAEIDARIDELLKSSARGAPATPKASEQPKPKTRGKGRKAAAANRKTHAEPASASHAEHESRQTEKAEKPKKAKRAKASKAPKSRKAKGGGPTMKDRLLGLLQTAPQGLDVATLAQEVYGGNDKQLRAKCESYMYNLAKKKLVEHHGSLWHLAAA